MQLQTRLSILLFGLLASLALGSTLILQEELRKSSDAHALQLEQLRERGALSQAEEVSASALRGIQALLRSRQLELEVQARLASSSTGVAEALVSGDPGHVQKLEQWLRAAHPSVRLHLLLDARGRAPGLVGSTEGPLAPRQFSMLEPPSVASSVSLQSLMESALAGKTLSGVETFSADLLALLTGQPVQEGGTAQTLLVWAIHPVMGESASVLGAVLLGIELAKDEAFVQQLTDLLGSQASAALVVSGQYARRMGSWVPSGAEGFTVGAQSPHWQQLLSTGRYSGAARETLVMAEGFKSQGGGVVGALEITVPLRLAPADASSSTVEDPTAELRQHGMGLIGILAVLLLTAGILVSRTLWAPLARLVKKAELASTGKLDESFKEVMIPGEIGTLARSFDRMRVSLKKLLERSSGEKLG